MAWRHFFLSEFKVELSEFKIEEAWSCPAYIDHFKLLLATDAENVLRKMRMTSYELDMYPF